MPSTTAAEILELFARSGDSRYGGEAVSQREHALQAAWFAEREGAGPELITAALLHDVGHLLHELPEDAPDQGIDDRHEDLAASWLAERFGAAVAQPVRLHVAAKRYLSAVDDFYRSQLSAPSAQSLALQGGPMTTEEIEQFRRHPQFESAVRLRRWDDAAKVPQLVTPPLEHFLPAIQSALAGGEN